MAAEPFPQRLKPAHFERWVARINPCPFKTVFMRCATEVLGLQHSGSTSSHADAKARFDLGSGIPAMVSAHVSIVENLEHWTANGMEDSLVANQGLREVGGLGGVDSC